MWIFCKPPLPPSRSTWFVDDPLNDENVYFCPNFSKQEDILIQTKVGKINSNDSQQVCIALKWLKPREKCIGGSFVQHMFKTVSLYLDWTC